eukprot:13310190-Alexandrium_andersonii.AAC.1
MKSPLLSVHVLARLGRTSQVLHRILPALQPAMVLEVRIAHALLDTLLARLRTLSLAVLRE